jgi:small subunit ribosomal protein S5
MAAPQQKKRKDRKRRGNKPVSEFDQQLIEVSRVTRVQKGGKRLSFRAAVVVGNRKGKVGMGVGKALDTAQAIDKAVTYAKKHLVSVPIVNDTIPHDVKVKDGAAVIFLKPAPKGSGLIAGGPVRSVLELAGIPNVVGKIIGTKNKINCMRAALKGLAELTAFSQYSKQTEKKKSISKESTPKK